MERGISVVGIAGPHGYAVEYPEQCPICYHYSQVKTISTTEAQDGAEVQVVFQCGFGGCTSYFIGYYGPLGQKELTALKPRRPQPTSLPPDIQQLSPMFASIYREADDAASLGLTQIAGPGYRKAFEFLIKDYAKSLQPDKAKEIEECFSGVVVAKYVSDPRIQAVAKRSLWLGNDETHYLRKWTNHDVDDLTTLIKLTVHWIEIDCLSRQYNESMPG